MTNDLIDKYGEQSSQLFNQWERGELSDEEYNQACATLINAYLAERHAPLAAFRQAFSDVIMGVALMLHIPDLINWLNEVIIIIRQSLHLHPRDEEQSND